MSDLIRRSDALKLFEIHGMVVRRDFEGIPAVDAVEVVRCKDCLYRGNRMTGCPKLLGLETADDFFCAKGKPKEDGV